MAKQKFEEALARLEQITRELEEGDLPLEESLKAFDEGVKLAELCNRKLDEAQKRVDLLLKKDGGLTAVPFGEAEQPTDADEE
jgi:exodeoxyribonuclease VII small subunit